MSDTLERVMRMIRIHATHDDGFLQLSSEEVKSLAELLFGKDLKEFRHEYKQTLDRGSASS